MSNAAVRLRLNQDRGEAGKPSTRSQRLLQKRGINKDLASWHTEPSGDFLNEEVNDCQTPKYFSA